MTTLITIHDGTPTTTSIAIAEGTRKEHKSVIQLIRQYQADLEEFGLVTFEMRPRPKGQHGGGNTEVAILNERQATLTLTYMRNTAIVREFKKRLVKGFYEMAEAQAKATPILPPVQKKKPKETLEQVLSDPAYGVTFGPLNVLHLLPHHSDPSFSKKAEALIADVARELSDSWRVYYMARLKEDVLIDPVMRVLADRLKTPLMKLAVSTHQANRDTYMKYQEKSNVYGDVGVVGRMWR